MDTLAGKAGRRSAMEKMLKQDEIDALFEAARATSSQSRTNRQCERQRGALQLLLARVRSRPNSCAPSAC